MLLESTLVSTSLGGVLTVDKRVVFLSILVGMGKCYLDVIGFHVYDRIECIGGHVVTQQVFKSVA